MFATVPPTSTITTSGSVFVDERNPAFDLVRDVRDDPDRAAEISPRRSLRITGVNLAGRDVAGAVKVFIGEPLVVPQVEVGPRRLP